MTKMRLKDVLVVSGMVVLGACVDARSAEEVKGAACDIPSSTSDGSCVVDSGQDPALPEESECQGDICQDGQVEDTSAGQDENVPTDLAVPGDASAWVGDAAPDAVPEDTSIGDAAVNHAESDACQWDECSPCSDDNSCAPDQLFCQSESGILSCDSAVEAPFAYGDIVAQPIVPKQTLRLAQFGVRTGVMSGSCNLYMSLYEDDAGEPGPIINTTPYQGLKSNSLNFLSPLISKDYGVLMTAGKRFWLVARLGGHPHACRLLITDGGIDTQFRVAHPGITETPGDMVPGQTQMGSGGAVSIFIRARL